MALIGVGTLMLASCAWSADGLALGHPEDRADRLVSIAGERPEALTAEFRAGDGEWRPATICLGATVDEWRLSDPAVWNGAATEGRLLPGEQTCLWNWIFDASAAPVEFRLTGVEEHQAVAELLA